MLKYLSPRNMKILAAIVVLVLLANFSLYAADNTSVVVPTTHSQPPSPSPPTTQSSSHLNPKLADAKNYVVLSSNTDLERAFALPLTCLIWKIRFEVQPFVILVGTEEEWKKEGLATVVSYLRQFGVEFTYLSPLSLKLPSDVDDTEVLSQISPLFATQLANFDENSYVLIGDADLWPINTDIFLRDPQKQILVTNADCCGKFSHNNKEYAMYSMNHIGMSAETWKEVMQITGNNIETSITQKLQEYFPNSEQASSKEVSQYAQKLISLKIQNLQNFASQTEVRKISLQTIGKSAWSSITSLSQYENAILPSSPFNPVPWQQISQLLSDLLRKNHMESVISYYTEWVWNVPIVTPMPTGVTWSEFGTHMFPLMTAVMATSGPVFEMGSGYFSTPLLHAACSGSKRFLLTADTDQNWLSNFYFLQRDWHKLVIVPVYTREDGTISDGYGANDRKNASKWDDIGNQKWGVVFVDHRPGERRRVDVERFRYDAEIIVVHDTEASGYGYEPVFRKFKYRHSWKQFSVQTTLLSETVDVTALMNGAL